VGVLTVTPDSFSDGGLVSDPGIAIEHARQMVAEGVDVIDVGGESSRPTGNVYGSGACAVDVATELARVIPVVRAICQETHVPVSVDTTKSEVAAAALAAGAQIINDISGLTMDPRLAEVVADAGCPIVVMHMRGTPQTTHQQVGYQNVATEVRDELAQSVDRALQRGVSEDQIIVDPGIGFGKNTKENLELLGQLSLLQSLGRPLFVGPSRKAFIGEILEGAPVGAREWGTAAAVAASVLSGANFLRVHQVGAMRDVARVAQAIGRQHLKKEGESCQS